MKVDKEKSVSLPWKSAFKIPSFNLVQTLMNFPPVKILSRPLFTRLYIVWSQKHNGVLSRGSKLAMIIGYNVWFNIGRTW